MRNQQRTEGFAIGGLGGAVRHPDRTLGAVLVDGAFPYDWLDEAMKQRIREQFRRLSWFMPPPRPTGPAPRMTAEHTAGETCARPPFQVAREASPRRARTAGDPGSAVIRTTSWSSSGTSRTSQFNRSAPASG